MRCGLQPAGMHSCVHQVGAVEAHCCRASDSLSAVANRAAPTTQSFKLRPSSATQASADPAAPTPDPPDSTPPLHHTSSQPINPSSHAAMNGTTDSTQKASVQNDSARAGRQGATAGANTAGAQTAAQGPPIPRAGGLPRGMPPRQLNPQQTAVRDMRSSRSEAPQAQQPSGVQQQVQNSNHLNLHQSDVSSPLHASAPRQVRHLLHILAAPRQVSHLLHIDTGLTSAGEAHRAAVAKHCLDIGPRHHSMCRRLRVIHRVCTG